MANMIGGFWRRCIARTMIGKRGTVIDDTTCEIVPAAEAKRGWSASTASQSALRQRQGLAFCEGCRR